MKSSGRGGGPSLLLSFSLAWGHHPSGRISLMWVCLTSSSLFTEPLIHHWRALATGPVTSSYQWLSLQCCSFCQIFINKRIITIVEKVRISFSISISRWRGGRFSFRFSHRRAQSDSKEGTKLKFSKFENIMRIKTYLLMGQFKMWKRKLQYAAFDIIFQQPHSPLLFNH